MFQSSAGTAPQMRSASGSVAPAIGAVLAMIAVMVVLAAPGQRADAHGSVSNPPSRTYTCRFLEPSNTACAQAWAANSQALYDWMEVNIGDVAGDHQGRIADGELCSASRAKYAAFDLATADWPTTHLTPDADGFHRVSFSATAPHATEYFRFYITKPDFDAATPLAWGDLELVHDSGPLPGLSDLEFTMALPERSANSILYQVWQRSDSPEAFYSCSDVTIGPGGVTGTPVPTTSPTATPQPQATATPVVVPTAEPTPTSVPSGSGLLLDIDVYEDWGNGYCATAGVTNAGSSSVVWTAVLPGNPTVTSMWDAGYSVSAGIVTASGKSWNATLAAAQSTAFGYCATGTAPSGITPTATVVPTVAPTPTATAVPTVAPTPTATAVPTVAPTPTATAVPTVAPTVAPTATVVPTVAPTAVPGGGLEFDITVTTSWGSGYCANGLVTNTDSSPVRWSVDFDAPASITAFWNGAYTINDDVVTVTGPHWRRFLRSGQSTTFGFCASN